MLLALKISVLFSLILTSLLCFQLWPHRKTILPRLLMVNMALYFLWAFWVLLTMLTEGYEARIFLTKVRQITNPFLISIWIVLSALVFHRSFWDRHKKWFLLLFALPVVTSLTTLLSVCGSSMVESLVAFNFQEISGGGGVLSYQSGYILKAQFIYGGILLVALNLTYFVNLFSKKNYLRYHAAFLMAGGVVPIFMEIVGRYYLESALLVQMNSGLSWFMVLAFYYGVTRLEFLNIKSFAQQKIFEQLPSPLVTLNPRGEIWDANESARQLLGISLEDFGKQARGMQNLEALLKFDDQIIVKEKTFQVFRREIPLHGGTAQGLVFILSDVTGIVTLNRELEENNQTLQALNSEIWRITTFNKKVQTVLSHDMTGVLASIHSLVDSAIQKLSEKGDSVLSAHMHRVLQASSSSMDLLRNILTWSHDDAKSAHVDVAKSLGRVISQMSPQVLEKGVNLAKPSLEKSLYVKGSSNMLETILRNVLANAIKFSPAGAAVVVEVEDFSEVVEIKIRDMGKGMSSDEIETVLSLKQIDSDLDGYGVGLRFTLEFVEQLAGKLWIESAPGRGTTVAIRLPMAQT